MNEGNGHGNGLVGREQFLALGKRPRRMEPVDIPELGGNLYVRSLTASERDQWEFDTARERAKGKAGNFRARLLVLAACDQSGAPLFRPEDAEVIGAMEQSIVEAVVDRAWKLNRMTPRDLEEVGKNSQPVPSES
jgi:hypothetical protein